MVASCSVPGCGNDFGSKKNLRMHGFPLSNGPVVQQWIKATGRVNWYPSQHSKICSDHFCPNDYASAQRLKSTAIPCRSLPVPVQCFHGEEMPAVPLVQATFYNRDPLQELNIVCEDTMVQQEEVTCSMEDEEETTCNQEIVRDIHKTSQPILTMNERKEIELKKKYNNLRKKVLRQTKKITKMNSTIEELQKQLNDKKNNFDLFHALEGKVPHGMTELLKDEVSIYLQSSFNRRFPDHRKKFALTLFQYSPEAYAFLGDYLTLPARRTLNNWVSPKKSKPTEEQNQIVCEDQVENFSEEPNQIVNEDENEISEVEYEIICIDENEIVCEDETP